MSPLSVDCDSAAMASSSGLMSSKDSFYLLEFNFTEECGDRVKYKTGRGVEAPQLLPAFTLGGRHFGSSLPVPVT